MPSSYDCLVVPATSDHIEQMLGKVRQMDINELWAASLATPEQALRLGLAVSTSAYTAFVNGEIVCMFGVAPQSLISGIGVPWLIGTPLIEKYARFFARESRKHLSEMLFLYPLLSNYVDVRNTAAIRWLKWLGFSMDEPAPHGALGYSFIRFYRGDEYV